MTVCQTCKHTMHAIETGIPGSQVSWCPSCGAWLHELSDGKETIHESHPPTLAVLVAKLHDAEACGNYDAEEKALIAVYGAIGRTPPT